MSVYKRPGSEVWWMNIYRGPGRKRIQKSTGKKSEAEARIVEQGYVALNRGEANREKLLRLVDLMCPGEEQGLKLEELGEWYRAMAAEERVKLSAKGMKNRVNLCGRLAEWARMETRCHVTDDVTPPVAWQFSVWLGKEGASAKSRNDYVSSLGTVWKMLIKRAKAKENPWTLARVQRDKNEEEHGRAFTREEEARLFAEAKKVGHEWYEACVIARWTGMRLADVKDLAWSEVDFDNGWIHYEPKKTKRHGIKVDIPMHRELRKMLEERRTKDVATPRTPNDERWVLPERHGHDGKKYFKGDKPFSKILEMAGIEEREGETITFHCWRHTFDTRLSEAGVAQDTRMAMTGHRVRETETIYNHDRKRLVEAIGKMR